MDTESSAIPTEISSSTSLPNFQSTATHVIRNDAAVTTTSTSERDVYAKEMVIRGKDTLSVKVHVNVTRERMITNNLIANRGRIKAETASGQEG